ncbi:MAG: flagellar assembly protein FliH [Campylobacterota bacterium]|nr:flagellar assembly protein FliH [Campylobacterota bacterium]
MAIVISKDKMQKYNVGAYHFKVLSNGENDTHEEVEHEFVESNHINNASPVKEKPKVTQVDSSAISQNSKDALIESLMKNNDEMSSNFIKLQMKLESKEEEYKAEVEKVKAGTFNEGVAAGKLEAQKEFEVQMADRFTQFSNSVATLNESANEFNGALEAIKNSLMNAAIDIATEVINVELSENSSEIAKVLSQELIKELQNASEVTLKVNPTDLEDISNSIASLEHIKVKSDSAVSAGGVIAISDAGNIDAQISKRFERVKKAALSE